MKSTTTSFSLFHNRVLYFDYLEVLAIFLVVSIHRPWFNHSYSSNVLAVLCSICVPLFFMVNGALLFHKTFNLKKHLIKIFSLFIAVEGWHLIYLFACIITRQVQLNNFSKTDIWYYFCGFRNLDKIPTAHMWFTNTLIFLYILFPLLKVCWDHNKNILYFFTIICLCFFQLSEEINVLIAQLSSYLHITASLTIDGFRSSLSPLSSNGHFLVYFVLGAILHDLFCVQSNSTSKFSKKARPYCVFFIIAGFLWDLFAKYLQCKTFIWTGESFKNGYLKLGTLFMCIGIFVLTSTVDFHKCPTRLNTIVVFISKRTLDIYYIHMFFAAYALDFIYPRFQIANVAINSIRVILIIMISLCIGQLIRKLPILKRLLNS